MTRPHASIETQLHEAYTTLTNIRTSITLRDALAAYGYTEERLLQGEALRQAAEAQYHDKINVYGTLRQISDTQTTTEEQIRYTYKQHLKIARIALDRNQGALEILSAAGERKTSFAGWLAQAQHFYHSALADEVIQNQLNLFGLSRYMLDEGAQQVERLAAQQAARKQQRSLAQHTTSVRDTALAALNMWIRDLRKVARVALRDTPQLLEQIDMIVRS